MSFRLSFLDADWSVPFGFWRSGDFVPGRPFPECLSAEQAVVVVIMVVFAIAVLVVVVVVIIMIVVGIVSFGWCN